MWQPLIELKCCFFKFKYKFTVVPGKEIWKKKLYFRPISSFNPAARQMKSTTKWSHFAEIFLRYAFDSARPFQCGIGRLKMKRMNDKGSIFNIQMRALAIIHLKYWFRISSILERTKNSTKTSNTSFERSGSGLFKFWRLGAWHSYWPATPTLYDKLNFLGEEGVASPWCCHAPVLHRFFCLLSGLSNEILYVFVPFLLFL